MLTGKVFSLLYIDLDRFKAYNEYFGYKKGDEIIQLTAEILTDRLENGGFIGQIGGDDYIVILNHYELSIAIVTNQRKFFTSTEEIVEEAVELKKLFKMKSESCYYVESLSENTCRHASNRC